MHVVDCLMFCFAVGYATRKIWNYRNEPATFRGRQPTDLNSVLMDVYCLHDRTSSMNSTSHRIYGGLIGRLKGMVKMSGRFG